MLDPGRYYVSMDRCDKEALKMSGACGERQAGRNHGASTEDNRYIMRMMKP